MLPVADSRKPRALAGPVLSAVVRSKGSMSRWLSWTACPRKSDCVLIKEAHFELHTVVRFIAWTFERMVPLIGKFVVEMYSGLGVAQAGERSPRGGGPRAGIQGSGATGTHAWTHVSRRLVQCHTIAIRVGGIPIGLHGGPRSQPPGRMIAILPRLRCHGCYESRRAMADTGTTQLAELGNAAFGQIFFFFFSLSLSFRYARFAGEMCPREKGDSHGLTSPAHTACIRYGFVRLTKRE